MTAPLDREAAMTEDPTDQLVGDDSEPTRWQRLGPWLIGAVAVAALLIGLRFVPAEAGPTSESEPAVPSRSAPLSP